MDSIVNKYIRGTAQVKWFRHKDKEAGMRWFGHVQSRELLKEEEDEDLLALHPQLVSTFNSVFLAMHFELT